MSSPKPSRLHEAPESSPLLADGEQQQRPSHLERRQRRQRQLPGWRPSIVALTALCSCILAVLLVVVGFAPAVVKKYLQQAAVLDPPSLSFNSFSISGVRVRIRARAELDAGRVESWSMRTLGRMGTTVVGSVWVEGFELHIRLPDHGHVLLGTVQVPGMMVSFRDGDVNELDFVANTQPGSLTTIYLLANDYMRGSLESLKVVGEVNLTVCKGPLSFNLGAIAHELVLKDIPRLPTFNLLSPFGL